MKKRLETLVAGLFIILILNNLYAQNEYSWTDCVKQTLENNPDLISSKQNILQAGSSLIISKSNRYPSVQGGLSKQFTETSSDSYSLSASLLLFNAGRVTNQIKKSQYSLTQAETEYAIVSSKIRRDLRSAFIDLLTSQENFELSKKIFERRKNQSDLIELRYEAGREHKGSLMTAQALTEQAAFDVKKAERNIRLAQINLSKVIGIDISYNASVETAEGTFDADFRFDKDIDFDSLMNNNPSIVRGGLDKDIALINKKIYKADLFPSLSASARHSGSISEADSDNNITTGMSLSIPIFEGGSIRENVKKADYALKQKQSDFISLRNDIIYLLQERYTAFQNACDNVSIQKRFYDAALERATISEAQYSSGLLSFDDWIVIEDNLVSSQRSLLNAKASALINEAEWIYAQGGTLENE
ncbi:MAG: TolC family protein [Elusimicrobiota bacterium]